MGHHSHERHCCLASLSIGKLIEEDTNLPKAYDFDIKRCIFLLGVIGLHSKHIPLKKWYILRQEFSLVLKLHEDQISKISEKGISWNGLAKLYCWNLTLWDKCVYIDGNSLVLQNIDNLFDYENFSAPLCIQNPKLFSTNVFCFRPNLETYEGIMDTVLEINSELENEDDVLNTYFGKRYDSAQNQICHTLSSFAHLTDTGKKILPKIVHFAELPWIPSKLGMESEKQFENFANQWLTIFSQDVNILQRKIKKKEVVECLVKSILNHQLPLQNAPGDTIKFIKDQHVTDLHDTIAVVGMSCRFPGANNTDEFWKVLVNGVDVIGNYPIGRPIGNYNRRGFRFNEKRQLIGGFLKCPVDEFDAQFFGISPREAPLVDPQQRILLEVIWESLENAGIDPTSLHNTDTTGVYTGMWQQDYDRMLPNTEGSSAFPHRYLGNAFSATAARISYFLGLNGPNHVFESGCSSSLAALHMACQSLQHGDINIAISGGVNLVLNEFNSFGGWGDSPVLSKDHRCKTFDESANGFVRSEGCGVLILKRYSDAVRDGDIIHALIRGSALNHDGSAPSFGTPNPEAQEKVIIKALRNANVDPLDVSYVEAHGTGTAVGDPTEMHALTKVYSGKREAPLIVSSVKSNIGHTESCAGMAGIIKVILCLQHQTIPPHLHFKSINPRIHLDAIPAIIPIKQTEWKGTNRIAAVSSFSFTGTNCHVLLQVAPDLNQERVEKDLQPQLITLSAKSETALNSLIGKYLEFLRANLKTKLVDIAYATNVCRGSLSHRMAVVATDVPQLLKKLESMNCSVERTPPIVSKIAFLFSGQGSQYIGMSQNLYNIFPAYKAAFEITDLLFQQHFGISLQKVVWKEPQLLAQTIYCQPAIFCIQYAITKLWAEFGIQPDIVLGHSMGEFGAAACAGILSLDDTMTLVVGRSRLVNRLPPGSMLALKTTYEEVQRAIKSFELQERSSWVDIAAVNSDNEVVVSGNPSVIQMFSTYCDKNGIDSQSILASHAFHSREMDGILLELGNIASQVTCYPEKCTYISGTLARQVTHQDLTPKYWQNQLKNTVMFSDAIKIVLEECKVLVEIGAQPVLLRFAMTNAENPSIGSFCPSLRKGEEEWVCVFNSLGNLFVAGIKIDWKNWFGTRKKNLILPNYPFQRQKYWYTEEAEETFSVNSPLIHPLLGTRFSSPTSETIFCHVLNLKELKYLEHHKVADNVIVPAAAYLEWILAVGQEIVQFGSTPLSFKVQDFCVEAALGINTSRNVQTIVKTLNSDDGGEIQYEVSIQSQAGTKWKRHTSATITPVWNFRNFKPELNIRKLVSNLDVKGDIINGAYKALADLGIKLESHFRSLKAAWSGENEVLTQISLPEDSQNYICHPIVLDAMIQTYVLKDTIGSGILPQQLQLPVRIRKFVWLSLSFTTHLYVHVEELESQASVNLYNEEGQLLASMECITTVETTVSSFLRSLNTEHLELPAFWEEVWRPCTGITSSRIDTALLSTNLDVASSCQSKFALQIESRREQIEAWSKLNGMFVYFVARALQECGWEFSVGDFVEIEQLRTTISSYLQKTGILESCLELLSMEGYMKNSRIVKSIPTPEECDKQIRNLENEVLQVLPDDDANYRFVKRIGLNYSDVFRGYMSPLQLLFPNDPLEFGAQRVYAEGGVYQMMAEQLLAWLLDLLSPFVVNDKCVIRILEVGGGTGGATGKFLDGLASLGVSYHYTFTDISPILISGTEKRLGARMTYGVLNVEKDPLEQGFAPEQFDVIIAIQVLHATSDLERSLLNLRHLLRSGGVICMSEQLVPIPVASFSFGLLESWWRFQDFRTKSPIIGTEDWTNLLLRTGYNSVVVQPGRFDNSSGVVMAKAQGPFTIRISDEKQWIIFHDGSSLAETLASKLLNNGLQVMIVQLESQAEFTQREDHTCSLDPTIASHFQKLILSTNNLEGVIYMWSEENHECTSKVQEVICAGLLHLCQAMIVLADQRKLRPKLVAVTRGIYYLGDSTLSSPNAATAWGLLKTFSNEHPEIPIILFDTNNNDVEVESQEIVGHLWGRDKEMLVALHGGNKYVQRLIPMVNLPPRLNLPSSATRCKLILPSSGSFSDIEIRPISKSTVKRDNVEVMVEAIGLNFRDLLILLKAEGFKVPQDQPLTFCSGVDFAGTISEIGPDVTDFKPGDHVFGLNLRGGFSTHIVLPRHYLMKMSDRMSFSDAATLPCAFLTAYYSLVVLAKLSPSDKVLIHAAAGGVGLAAIQVANQIGAEIYATAGSRRKRAYLKGLGIKHIYNSRNTRFGEEIHKDTQGTGVTIVLNSLTGVGFKEASLGACARGATFIEIAKLNIWSEADVQLLRPDVKYDFVDLAESLHASTQEILAILKEINEKYFHPGHYKSLPQTTFPLDLARQAFYYLQEARNIGKVVIKMPNSQISLKGSVKFKCDLFNRQSTYLVTGGLGGIGMEVAKWMTARGASTIVLVGRSPPSSKAIELIRQLESSEKCLCVIQGNLGKYADCERVLEVITALRLPPLRGIMHCAGLLSDGILSNQNWSKFNTTFEPKVFGTWNLHSLTLGLDLEHFIMFSSLASILAPHGQSNHSAGNRYLDCLAHYRVSLGLKATTINWGAWSDVGAAANIKIQTEVISATAPFTPQQGIRSLEEILQRHIIQTVVVDANNWNHIKQYVSLGNYLDEIQHVQENSSPISSREFDPTNILPEERQSKFESYLEVILKQTLRLPDNESIVPEQGFTELGVDSLMTMELRNRLQRMLGSKILSMSALQQNRTIRTLSTHLANLFNSDSENTTPVSADIFIQDSVLPIEISVSVNPPLRPSQFKHVLLTGATGHLGSHILLELTKLKIHVFCIIRGSTKIEASERLVMALTRHRVLDQINTANVKVLVGDVSSYRLGLDKEYQHLIHHVDAIIHCAAKVNHIQSYTDDGETSMRNQNVLALINVISFAGDGKIKPILYASSIAAVNRLTSKGHLSENYPDDRDNGENFHHGYMLSKFVCEKLMAQASDRGIPVTVLRYPILLGNSDTGFMAEEQDHVWNYLLTCFLVKMFPLDLVDLLVMPVDVAAQVSIKLFLNDLSELGVYNLTSDSEFTTKDVVNDLVTELGIDVQYVPFVEWRTAVFENDTAYPLSPWKFLFEDVNGCPWIHTFHPVLFQPNDSVKHVSSQKLIRNLLAEENVLVPTKISLMNHVNYRFSIDSAAYAAVYSNAK